MRRICWILLITWLGTVPLHAQGSFWCSLFARGKQTTPRTAARTQYINVSRQLDRRVARTYRQALKDQQAAPQAYQTMPFGEPINDILHPEQLDPHVLYPDQDFLVTSQQTANYLAARNNILVRQELRRAEQLRLELNQTLPALEQASQQLDQPVHPQEFAPWVVRQIPLGAQYLFIGEQHGYTDIHNTVIQLLHEVRTLQPKRKIFLFTEFLPENVHWDATESAARVPSKLRPQFPIWEKSTSLQIPVIGLEPEYAISDECQVRRRHLAWYKQKEGVWETLEGVRLRNESWQRTLAKYRTQFPDALFIIYAGADHCMYNRPFALPNRYAPEQVFVVTLHPATRMAYQSAGFLKIAQPVQVPAAGPLERITHTDKFPQPVLKWDDPQLVRISGFNVRLKIPILTPSLVQ